VTGLLDRLAPTGRVVVVASNAHRRASAAGIEFKYVHVDLEFDGQVLKDVAVRYKGNGTFMQSRGSLKRSLKVDLNKYVKGQKLAGLSRLNFHNNVTDASWMNEVLSHRLFRDAGVPASRSAYARIFVTVPGKYDKEYFGLIRWSRILTKTSLRKLLARRKARCSSRSHRIRLPIWATIGKVTTKPMIRRRTSRPNRNSVSSSFANSSPNPAMTTLPPNWVITLISTSSRASWP